jgi:hypothetical protein
VLGLASRQFKAVLSGAGTTKGSNMRKRAAGKGREKEKEKERESAKDDHSSPKREGEGKRKEDDGGSETGLLQLRGLASYLLMGTLASADANPPTSTSRGHGRRGNSENRGGSPPTAHGFLRQVRRLDQSAIVGLNHSISGFLVKIPN